MSTIEQSANFLDYSRNETPSWLDQVPGSRLNETDAAWFSHFFSTSVLAHPHTSVEHRAPDGDPVVTELMSLKIPDSDIFFLATKTTNVITRAESYSINWVAEIAQNMLMTGEKSFEKTGDTILAMGEHTEILGPTLTNIQMELLDKSKVNASRWKIPLLLQYYIEKKSNTLPEIPRQNKKSFPGSFILYMLGYEDRKVRKKRSQPRRENDYRLPLRKRDILSRIYEAQPDSPGTNRISDQARQRLGYRRKAAVPTQTLKAREVHPPVPKWSDLNRFFQPFYDVDPFIKPRDNDLLLDEIEIRMQRANCRLFQRRKDNDEVYNRVVILEDPESRLIILIDMERYLRSKTEQSRSVHFAWIQDLDTELKGHIGQAVWQFKDNTTTFRLETPESSASNWRFSFLEALLANASPQAGWPETSDGRNNNPNYILRFDPLTSSRRSVSNKKWTDWLSGFAKTKMGAF